MDIEIYNEDGGISGGDRELLTELSGKGAGAVRESGTTAGITCEEELTDMPEIAETAADTRSNEDKDSRIAELTEKLRAADEERVYRERELLCRSLLNDAELPDELAPVIMAYGEKMEETVELIRRTVREKAEAEISARCRTEAPLSGKKVPLTKEELIKTPVAELQRLRDFGQI